MGLSAGRAFQGLNHHLLDLGIAYLAGRSWPGLVVESFQARAFKKRERHLPTMPSEARIFRATVLLSSPSAQANTRRARRARSGWLRARWASDCNRSRSSSVNIRACLGRPVRI